MKLKTILATLASVLVANVAFAADATTGGSGDYFWALAIGCGLIMGIASGLGALGQSRAAAAALEGIARNPQASDKLFTPMILSLALMESLVLFAFGVCYLLQAKIPG